MSRGVVKVEGVSETPRVLFWLAVTNIFEKVYACNLVCRLESSFLYLFYPKKTVKIACFYDFFIRKPIFFLFQAILYVHDEFSRNFEGALKYDVLVTSYQDGWYFRWYQWKEDTNSYTLVANTRVKALDIENPGMGVATIPIRRTCYRRMAQEDEGKTGQWSYTQKTWPFICKMSNQPLLRYELLLIRLTW